VDWSYSASKMFLHCPRKWFYHEVVADGRNKDELQKEATYLKKLQSVYAWRGSLVDYVISSYAVPKLNKKELIDENALVQYALITADKQVEAAQRYDRVKQDENENDFQFYDIEYGGKLSPEEIEKAKGEISQSLRNFAHSSFMSDFRKDGNYIASQRMLKRTEDGVTISATPDLIAFYESDQPQIVDWKVQTSSHVDHWRQLALYCMMLTRVDPHRDFPQKWHETLSDPKKIRLLEFQLLQSYERPYQLEDADIVEIENYIYTSSNKMKHLLNGRKYPAVKPEDIPTTTNPANCARCQFRRICWEGNAK
jgi:hypothetical protein